MQATYIMAAHQDALEYLPAGADLNNLTWQQLGDWCKAIYDGTGEARCGLPHAGLFHRFLQGYMWPSFTGGMVSNFQSNEAAAMLEWLRDDLWPYVNPQSINYAFMQEPLLAGEVWVAFDHTARLLNAFNEKPDEFVAFPAPAGPAGLGFMPVIVGLGIPKTAPNPEAAMQAIDYLTTPEVQARVLKRHGLLPRGGRRRHLRSAGWRRHRAGGGQRAGQLGRRAAGAATGGPGRTRRRDQPDLPQRLRPGGAQRRADRRRAHRAKRPTCKR